MGGGNNTNEAVRSNTNMPQQAKTDRPRPALLDKSVDIEPVGVIYNVAGSAVQDFISDYLTNIRKVSGIEAVRAHVVREGSQRPEVSLYIFINPESKDIVSNLGNVPQYLKRKMDDGQYRLSDKLKDSLYPITRDFKVFVHPERMLYVKADIFKVLGLMFKSDPSRFNLTIAKVEKLKKRDSSLMVVKEVKFIESDDGSSRDRYDNLINKIEYRDRDDD